MAGGVNDIVIIASIIAIFIAVGVALPFVQADLQQPVTVNDPHLAIDASQAGSAVSAYTVIASVVSMFFWSFGALPIWLDTVFLFLRIVLAITIARNVWIGGGG